MRRLIGAVCFIATVLLLQFTAIEAQEGPGEFHNPQLHVLAHEVDFPAVTIRARVSDSGRPVPALEADDFEIVGDEYEDLRVTQAEVPLNLAVVVDLAQDISLDPIKSALTVYFTQFYQDGDNVAFVTLRNRQPTLHADFSSREDILAFINDLSNPAGYNPYPPGIDTAAEWLESFTADGQNGQILVIGTFFGAGDEQRTHGRAEQIAQQAQIPIHAIYAHQGPGSFTRVRGYEVLAERGLGLFADFTGDISSPDLQQLYSAIQANRAIYVISYKTMSGEEGERSIEIVARQGEQTFQSELVYEGPSFEAPRVDFVEPAEDARIRREPVSEGSSELTHSSQSLEVRITFPDGFEREIVEGVLVVDVGGLQDRYPIEDPALDADGNMRVRWDLSDFEANPDGGLRETEVTLKIEVIDQYGKEGVGFVDVTVVVDTPLLEDLEEDDDSDQPVAGGTNGGSASDNTDSATEGEADNITDASGGVSGTSGETTEVVVKEEDESDNVIWYVAIGVLGVALLGVTFYALRQNKKLRNMVVPKAAQRTVMNMAAGIQKTMVGMSRMGRSSSDMDATMASGQPPAPAAPSAHLEVLRGSDQGRQLQLQGASFTIGRKAGSEIDYVANGFANVSSRHCRIIQAGNSYKIVDLGSSNGTFLNGQKLEPHREYPISSHSVIRLGQDEGISIQFRFVSSGSDSGGAMKTELDPGMQPMGGPPAKQQGGDWYLGRTQTFEDDSPPVPPPPPQAPPAPSGGYTPPPPPRRQDSDPGEWDRIDQLPHDDDWLRQ